MKSLLLLLGVAVLWILAVWFVLPTVPATFPDISKSLFYVLPPFFALGLWQTFRRWKRRRKARILVEREAAGETEREHAKAAAQQQREAELAHLRFACDCKLAVITGLDNGAGAMKAALPDAPLGEQHTDADEEDAAPPVLGEELQAFAAPLRQALESIYQQAPAALALPVYLVPPTHIPAIESIELVRRYACEIGADLDPPIEVAPDKVRITFATSGNSAADSALELFDRNPNLPGAVLLAFDSPVQRDQAAFKARATSEQRTSFLAELDERATWRGAPGSAVVALLLTHPSLEAMLAGIQGLVGGDSQPSDAMTPFWQKAGASTEELVPLSKIALEWREALGNLAVLTRVHRATFGMATPETRALEMTSTSRLLMEKALLAGSLITELDAADQEAKDNEPAPPVVRWLVHNAGTVERNGPRLSALAAALRYFGIDLHLLDEATNVASVGGDFGPASTWVMLAEAAVRSSELGASVLCADFQPDGGVSMSVASSASSR